MRHLFVIPPEFRGNLPVKLSTSFKESVAIVLAVVLGPAHTLDHMDFAELILFDGTHISLSKYPPSKKNSSFISLSFRCV